MLARYILVGIVVFAAHCVHPQDTLFYTNGKHVVGQVEEIGVELVRYHTFSAGTSVLIVAEKRDLARIKLEDGQEFVLNATEEFTGRIHAISMDFIAPALNHLTFGYERVVGRRISLAVRIGYIGIGRYYENSRSIRTTGALGKVGIKFILPVSRKRIPNARDEHPLAGWYLKPEFMVSAWHAEPQDKGYYYSYSYPYLGTKDDYVSAALHMTIGRHIVVGERSTFDLYGGIGYGAQWKNGQEATGLVSNDYTSRQEYSFSHGFLGSRTALTVSGGMTFGYLF